MECPCRRRDFDRQYSWHGLKGFPRSRDYPYMLAGIIDHLWQSIAFAVIVLTVTYLTRRNSAALQLWLWRIAALKWLLPFGLLYALGGWLGFPVRHTAIPPPAALTEWVSTGLSLAAPALTFGFKPFGATLALALLGLASAVCLWAIVRQLKAAQRLRDEEIVRREADFNFQARPLNFWQSALLASGTLLTVSLPVVAGATRDRQWRQEILAIDQQALVTAKIAMNEAPEDLGLLSRVTANNAGVTIRNINIKDLVSMVYGIEQFEVFGGAMPWLSYPRYDVSVTAPLYQPSAFDPYSLRQPVTNYLYAQFGVSIRVNGTCQKPCKDFESFVIERLRYCPRPLARNACNP
jgi:hypothetical protein